MKKERLFLILSIISIVFLLALTEFQKPIAEGKIKKITLSYPIIIELENNTKEFLIFEKNISLKENDEVKIFGVEQINKQIIVNKIICLNC